MAPPSAIASGAPSIRSQALPPLRTLTLAWMPAPNPGAWSPPSRVCGLMARAGGRECAPLPFGSRFRPHAEGSWGWCVCVAQPGGRYPPIGSATISQGGRGDEVVTHRQARMTSRLSQHRVTVENLALVAIPVTRSVRASTPNRAKRGSDDASFRKVIVNALYIQGMQGSKYISESLPSISIVYEQARPRSLTSSPQRTPRSVTRSLAWPPQITNPGVPDHSPDRSVSPSSLAPRGPCVSMRALRTSPAPTRSSTSARSTVPSSCLTLSTSRLCDSGP